MDAGGPYPTSIIICGEFQHDERGHHNYFVVLNSVAYRGDHDFAVLRVEARWMAGAARGRHALELRVTYPDGSTQLITGMAVTFEADHQASSVGSKWAIGPDPQFGMHWFESLVNGEVVMRVPFLVLAPE